jgi:cytosine deaminase
MDSFMQAAVEEAHRSHQEGGQAFGAVLARDGEIISRGRNRILQTGDPTAHAEIQALRNASVLETYAGTVMYATMLPCRMCSGAMVQLGVEKVVIGNSESYTNTQPYLRSFGIEVEELHLAECKALIDDARQQFPERYQPGAGRRGAD